MIVRMTKTKKISARVMFHTDHVMELKLPNRNRSTAPFATAGTFDGLGEVSQRRQIRHAGHFERADIASTVGGRSIVSVIHGRRLDTGRSDTMQRIIE